MKYHSVLVPQCEVRHINKSTPCGSAVKKIVMCSRAVEASEPLYWKNMELDDRNCKQNV